MVTIPDKTIFDDDVSSQLEETAVVVERPVLIMLDGADANQRRRIDKREVMIGRDLMCDVVLNDTRCSRKHACLVYTNFDCPQEPPAVVLQDQGSTNGVFVNGTRVSGEQKLNDRDKILMGSTLMGFFLRDESELQADQRLYQLANNDALTGLRNRGYFNIEIRKEYERSRRYGRALSLVMFDIDHFKRFNDTYGHQTGDMVLQEISRLAEANVRSNDIVARYGGEEFVVILPETGIEGALIQAERLRVAVMTHGFAREGTRLQLSISLGLASAEDGYRNTDDFIAAVDRALYHSKHNGRNRVSWARGQELFVHSPSTGGGL